MEYMRKVMLRIHRLLGRTTGVIVCAICLSGSMFVFADELLHLLNRKLLTLTPGAQMKTVDEMVENVRAAYPAHRMINVTIHNDRKKSAVFFIADRETGPRQIFVNPFTGDIIGESGAIRFFSLTAHFHKELLSGKTGSCIVGITSVIFLVSLLTGFAVCRPAKGSLKSYRRLLGIQHGGSFLKKTIDRHRVVGLLSIPLLCIVTVSGIAIACLPRHGIEAQKKNDSPQSRCIFADSIRRKLTLQEIAEDFLGRKKVHAVRIELWNMKKSPAIEIVSAKDIGIVTYTGDMHLVDKYDGSAVTDKKLTAGVQTVNFFRKLHVGGWLGLFGKLCTFAAGIAGAFLVLSGYVLWFLKRRKNSP